MKITFFVVALLLNPALLVQAFGVQQHVISDTGQVIKLSQKAYALRKTTPDKTISVGNKALELAKKLGYQKGTAEALRVIGIGYSYKFNRVAAYDNYLQSLILYDQLSDLPGLAKVKNNLGNLFRDQDFDRALFYFDDALKITQKVGDRDLEAAIYLNSGSVFIRKKKFSEALKRINQATKIFGELHSQQNLIVCDQNAGVACFGLRQFDKSLILLSRAYQSAKKYANMQATIVSIDLALADLYTALSRYNDADKSIAEGLRLTDLSKMKSDFARAGSQLEAKRENYKKAYQLLSTVFVDDSLAFNKSFRDHIGSHQVYWDHQAAGSGAQVSQTRTGNLKNTVLISSIAAALFLVLTFVLILNVKRKADTNRRLKELNAEVSRQKENVDRINHHLEEIIDERTRDLQIKNRKLSEYSSYLSHQIRGPIATLKGLMNLEKEGLVDKKECIEMMDKCVSEIDDKIIDMSDMLHDSRRAGF